MAFNFLGVSILPLLLLSLNSNQANDTISVVVDTSGDKQVPPPGATGPVSPSFTSFSSEWSSALLNVVDATYYATSLQLFRNLKEETGSGPWLRIGGNSADRTWYPILLASFNTLALKR